MLNFIRSFGYAFKGIRFAMAQRNFRVQLLCAVSACILGFLVQISAVEWCIVLLCVALVLGLETLNSALEHLVNLVSPGYHETAGKIKDLAAGAVLIASLVSLLIGLIIFGSHILSMLSV
jgi:diacylglycerol kinase